MCEACIHATTRLEGVLPIAALLVLRSLRHQGCTCVVVLELCQHQGFTHLTDGHEDGCRHLRVMMAGSN